MQRVGTHTHARTREMNGHVNAVAQRTFLKKNRTHMRHVTWGVFVGHLWDRDILLNVSKET